MIIDSFTTAGFISLILVGVFFIFNVNTRRHGGTLKTPRQGGLRR